MTAIDSASLTYGAGDGVSFCGGRSYTISPTSYTFMSLASDTLNLQSNDPTHAVGPITITVSATLDNYPSILPATQLFTIEVICEVMTLSWTTAPPTTYVHNLLVDIIPVSIPFQVTQSPLCVASLTFSLTDASLVTAPAWIYPVSDTHIEINPTLLSLVGDYAL